VRRLDGGAENTRVENARVDKSVRRSRGGQRRIYFDATFKVVRTIYYQLFTVFVPFADSTFSVFTL